MATRSDNARRRLLSKLPCEARNLTVPERAELRSLEREGVIYCIGYTWHEAAKLVRHHDCLACKVTWTSPTRLSRFTPNLSGEPAEECPACGSQRGGERDRHVHHVPPREDRPVNAPILRVTLDTRNRWRVQASITRTGRDGYQTTRQIPTFEIDGDLHGIVNEEHAASIAKRIVAPWPMQNERVSISAVRI